MAQIADYLKELRTHVVESTGRRELYHIFNGGPRDTPLVAFQGPGTRGCVSSLSSKKVKRFREILREWDVECTPVERNAWMELNGFHCPTTKFTMMNNMSRAVHVSRARSYGLFMPGRLASIDVYTDVLL